MAGSRCTAVASWSIGGCDPSSVITASLVCCAVHVRVCVCGVPRVSRKMRIWIFRNMVKRPRCPILDVMARVRASQSSCLFFPPTFSLNFFSHYVHVTQITDTTDNRQHTSSAVCAHQPVRYNAIHAYRLTAEQEATPHAIRIWSALCKRGFLVILLSDPAICWPTGLRYCVTHTYCPTVQVLQHRYFITS